MSHSLSPESQFRLSILQVIGVIAVVGAAGFSVGLLYPRLTGAEAGVAENKAAIAKAQDERQTQAELTAQASAILDRLSKDGERRDKAIELLEQKLEGKADKWRPRLQR